MRKPDRRTVAIGVVCGLVGALLGIVAVFPVNGLIQTMRGNKAPTIVYLPAQNDPDLATKVLPLETARKIMDAPNLELNTTPLTALRGKTSDVSYLTPDKKTGVSIQIYRESTEEFLAGYQSTETEYREHKNASQYTNTFVKRWPAGTTHTVGSATAIYTMRTAKYRHDLLFATDGRYSIRVRVIPSDNLKLLDIAETVLKNSKQF